MAIRILFLLITLSFTQSLIAQKGDPVLFSVENKPVHWSEFDYIYSKTNGPEATYSKESLQEYLDLYVNFKLKVHKAKDMKLDTIISLQQELAGYRRQLADSYLIDREVTEKLVQEAYQRAQQDVEVSHIMVIVPETATPTDTLQAWKKLMAAKGLLDKGKGFDDVAREYSEDKSAQKNGGHIGWVTALFPNGYYTLETAAYTAPEGKVVGPIRTKGGYHLLKVHGRRPARGEMEVAHILIRKDKNPDLIKARKKADEAHDKLEAGEDYDTVAKAYSEDKVTSNKGGYLGFFGINRYEKAFEEAAFTLAKDGDFTKPIETSIGWHIIKRINLKQGQTYQQMKAALQNKVKQDARHTLARQVMVEKIKKEGSFKEERTTLQNFITSLEKDSVKTFLTYKWKAPKDPSSKELFSFGGDMKVTLGEFENYLQRASRKRQQNAKKGIPVVVDMLYQEFVGDNALKYEERQLEVKYPEFKSLMREYEEGVLLFEVTKMKVWDKASQDTTGLQAFYDQNKTKYQWKDRAVVSQYSLLEKEKAMINQIREFTKGSDTEAVLARFNENEAKPILTVKPKTFEQGRNEILDKMEWKIGNLSPVSVNRRSKTYDFFKIEELLTPSQKSLKEARGYVVADYQDFLEVAWLKKLKDEYKVKINEKVFNKMVK